MFFIYNTIVIIAAQLIKLIAVFNPKMRLFVDGRKTVLETLISKIKPTDQTIWFHAASLGEYEQGIPVIEKVKAKYPNHKIVVSFFSPSGYEVRKNNSLADVTVYLPLDTQFNARKWTEVVHPTMVFFIKYEYWPNYLNELKKNQIPTYLISGIFRKDQLFFKGYGGFYRNALKNFTYFFVQNEASQNLLRSIGFNNVKISGDTRFDRVSEILNRNNSLDFVTQFKKDSQIVVIGSSWPKDEIQLVDFINDTTTNVKFIIAPHNIKKEQIEQLRNSISRKVVLFSEIENKDLANYDVLLIDTIGLLTKIYSYADMAYVGGGFGTAGLHNILEPATFGIPTIIGPNYAKFSEAVALVNMGGCISVKNKKEVHEVLSLLIQNEDERFEKGHICSTFVQMNKGATEVIMNHLQN